MKDENENDSAGSSFKPALDFILKVLILVLVACNVYLLVSVASLEADIDE